MKKFVWLVGVFAIVLLTFIAQAREWRIDQCHLTVTALPSTGDDRVKSIDNQQAKILLQETKLYSYRRGRTHGEWADWEAQYRDQWGGNNYWCIKEGDFCEKYDWIAIYPIAPDPCPQNNNSAYGDALVRAAAAAQGITLPDNLPLPEFSLE